MEFKSISSFLENFNRLPLPESEVKKRFNETLTECGVSGACSHVAIQGKIARISASSVLKHYLLLNKERVLEKFRQKMPGRTIEDIR